ncbi:MAG TPA: T9SS type A sorting domain-containing protein [Bacteroidia bacterium]|jgi:hypothetical protein|nr:T9SS type A sorting domain-containing protein [Bacteroidia bacterium]
MKKLLLTVTLFAGVLTHNAQENWVNIENMGFASQATFHISEVFQNKLYVGGDSTGHIQLFSSPSGNVGSFTRQTGLQAVLQPTKEYSVTSVGSNSTYMFLGSGTSYDTTGGATGITPQVYRFDGTTYTKHGTINFNSLPANNHFISGYSPFVSALALFSPTGSNDTVYAFVTPGSTNNISVWKAPASQANPTWINSNNFSSGSGVTKIYDTKVWHKKLYISVSNSAKGGMIMRTADGVNWDTVTTGLSLAPILGVNSFNDYFTALEVYKDTLIAGVTNSAKGIGFIYTPDSLATTQNWKALIDSAGCAGFPSAIVNISDFVVGDGKLWIETTKPVSFSPKVYLITKNSHNKDTLLTSSYPTGLESVMNYGDDYRLCYFNNSVYATGHSAPAAFMRSSGPHNTPATSMYLGNIWRFTTINPTPNFIDSVSSNTGFCQNNTIYLVNTSTNASSYKWNVNGAHYSYAKDTTFYTSVAGTFTVEMIAYNGNYQSLYKDSITKTILIHQNPMVTGATASSYTICQGQSDSLFTSVSGGKPPYTYTWHNTNDGSTYNGHNTTVITLYTVPSFSPYIYFYLSVIDSNKCQAANSPNLNIYVNKADSLSGTIRDTMLNPVVTGKVYLFKLNPLNPHPGDTTCIFTLGAGGSYYFPSVLYGSYIAKAVADTSNPLYKTAVGTYFSNKTYPFQWDSAKVIQHHTCTAGNIGGNNIKILQMPPPITGPGTISGKITHDSSYTGARYIGSGYAPLGAPLKGVDVKLGKNPGGNPAARTTTDNSGNYIFHNVPLGNYKIYVDIPNYGLDSAKTVTVNSVTPTSVGNNYYVDSSRIHLVSVTNLIAAICQGDSIKLGGAYQMIAGVYKDTLNIHGHDSILVTTLSVKPLPTLTVTTNADTICVGGSALLSATGNSASYLWSANAGSVTTATVSVSPGTTTIYTVTGTLASCPYSKTIKVAVKSCVGIQTVNQNGFAVYPNPAVDKLYIQSQKSGSMRLLNITGQVVLEQIISLGQNEINISSLPAGAYGISINSNGQITNSKLMISK